MLKFDRRQVSLAVLAPLSRRFATRGCSAPRGRPTPPPGRACWQGAEPAEQGTAAKGAGHAALQRNLPDDCGGLGAAFSRSTPWRCTASLGRSSCFCDSPGATRAHATASCAWLGPFMSSTGLLRALFGSHDVVASGRLTARGPPARCAMGRLFWDSSCLGSLCVVIALRGVGVGMPFASDRVPGLLPIPCLVELLGRSVRCGFGSDGGRAMQQRSLQGRASPSAVLHSRPWDRWTPPRGRTVHRRALVAPRWGLRGRSSGDAAARHAVAALENALQVRSSCSLPCRSSRCSGSIWRPARRRAVSRRVCRRRAHQVEQRLDPA